MSVDLYRAYQTVTSKIPTSRQLLNFLCAHVFSYAVRIAGVLCVIALVLIVAGWNTSGQRWKEFAFNLGMNMLNSSIIFSVLDIYFQNTRRNHITCKKGLDFKEFASKLRAATNEIYIMTTYFGPFTSMPEHRESGELMRDAFFEAIEANKDNPMFNIKVLMLDPDSKAAQQREADLKDIVVSGIKTSEPVIARIKETIYELLEVMQTRKGRKMFEKVTIRLLDSLPPFFMLKSDTSLSIVHYLPRVTVANGHRLELNSDADHAVPYTEATKYVWDKCASSTLQSKEMLAYIGIELPTDRDESKIWNVAYVMDDETNEVCVLLDTKRKFHGIINNLMANKLMDHEHGDNASEDKFGLVLHIGGNTGVLHTFVKIIHDKDDIVFMSASDKYGVEFNRAFVFKAN